jgi:hypothetical protein
MCCIVNEALQLYSALHVHLIVHLSVPSQFSQLFLLLHFHAGHRVPEALFFKVWQGGRLSSSREDWRVSCPGSLHIRSWTNRCDAGRGIPHLQALGHKPLPVSVLLVQQSLLLYMAVCHLCSVELSRYSLTDPVSCFAIGIRKG